MDKYLHKNGLGIAGQQGLLAVGTSGLLALVLQQGSNGLVDELSIELGVGECTHFQWS